MLMIPTFLRIFQPPIKYTGKSIRIMNLKDKKVFLTGGSSGIGKATAQFLREAGAKVLITGRNTEKLERVAQELDVIPLQMDMMDFAQIGPKAAEGIAKLGGVDVLINNAGTGQFSSMGSMTVGQFESVLGTNVIGLAMLTQEIVEVFIKQDFGDIVNVASTASLKGFAHGTIYAASKFALRGMTQCWQAELRKHNVRVIQVNPSEVPTAFAVPDRSERPNVPHKLTADEIAYTIKATLEMDRRGFVPEVTVWATNPQGPLGK